MKLFVHFYDFSAVASGREYSFNPFHSTSGQVNKILKELVVRHFVQVFKIFCVAN